MWYSDRVSSEARRGRVACRSTSTSRTDFSPFSENLLLGSKLSEFHTGYRAFSRQVLESLPLHRNSDDFVFDNEMLAQAIYFDYRVGEISCPTRYFAEASSINFHRSVVYGLGVLWTSVRFRLQKWGIARFSLFEDAQAQPHRRILL